MATKKTAASSDVESMMKIQKIEVPQLKIGVLKLRLKGDELIMNAFSAKSKQEMLDKQMGAAKNKRENKDPKANFEAARLRNEKGQDCVQANGLKLCFVNAARFTSGIPMTILYPGIFVRGTVLPIKYEKLIMREDVVRVGKFPNKTADIRHRPAYLNWSIDLELEYNASVFNASQLFNLVTLAGFHIGVGEWRPEKKGQHGRFSVEIMQGSKVAA